MGVLNLWKILNPISESIDINELKNKTLAIDLSIWICENSTQSKSYNHVSNTKPYLRALFFRCKYLLELNCKLIFVREGDIIDLKQDTMKKRQQTRYGDYYSQQTQQLTQQQSQTKKIQKRSKYDSVANECCELLKYMGITVIRSPCGEAEKACSYLNLIGRCDGVITDDSDVFLYGARCVYRNFSIDKKSECTIEEYKMDKIENKLGYSREMLIVLGLLLGNDYDQKGIPGVGKEMACKYLNELIELNECENILNRVRCWLDNNFVTNLKYEDKIRKLVQQTPTTPATTFPNEQIINEYLIYSKTSKILLSEEKYLKINWSRPCLMNIQLFNDLKQSWPYDYTTNKLIPLIIQYEYLNETNKLNRSIKPIRINKIKRKSFVNYYEVTWSKMIPKLNDRDLSDLNEYITLEKLDLFELNYPELTQVYKQEVENKKLNRNKKKKAKIINEDYLIDDDLADSLIELYESILVQETKSENINENLNENLNEKTILLCDNDNFNDEIEKTPNSQNIEVAKTKTKKKNKVKLKTTEKKNNKKENKENKENMMYQFKVIVLDTDDEDGNGLIEEMKMYNETNKDDDNDELDLNSLLKSFKKISLNSVKKQEEDKSDKKSKTTSKDDKKIKKCVKKILLDDIKEEKKIENNQSNNCNENDYNDCNNAVDDEDDILNIPFSQRMKKIYNNALIFK